MKKKAMSLILVICCLMLCLGGVTAQADPLLVPEDMNIVAIPSNLGYVYRGTQIVGVPSSPYYTLSGTIAATNTGNYTATATLKDNCIWSDGTYGPKAITWKISQAFFVSVTLENDTFDYTGSRITPTIKKILGSPTSPKTEGTDYTVSIPYSVNPGTYTVEVRGKGNFIGLVKATYTIKEAAATPGGTAGSPETTVMPTEPITINKAPASVRAKAKGRRVTITWKKIKKSRKNKALLKRIKGIEVQYSTNPNFPDGSIKRRIGKSKTKLVLSGLQRKTAYYVRVRYVDGAGGCSNWSAVKHIVIR